MMAFVILHNIIVEDERDDDEMMPFDPNEMLAHLAKAQIYE